MNIDQPTTTTVVYEELDQTETADIVATNSEPTPYLPVTGFEGSLTILGVSLVSVGLAALRTSRTKQ